MRKLTVAMASVVSVAKYGSITAMFFMVSLSKNVGIVYFMLGSVLWSIGLFKACINIQLLMRCFDVCWQLVSNVHSPTPHAALLTAGG